MVSRKILKLGIILCVVLFLVVVCLMVVWKGYNIVYSAVQRFLMRLKAQRSFGYFPVKLLSSIAYIISFSFCLLMSLGVVLVALIITSIFLGGF